MWEAKGAHFLATTPRHAGPSLSDSFKLPPEVRGKLFDEFCNVDSNGSGALDPEEMSALFSRLALHVPMRVRNKPSCPVVPDAQTRSHLSRFEPHAALQLRITKPMQHGTCLRRSRHFVCHALPRERATF